MASNLERFPNGWTTWTVDGNPSLVTPLFGPNGNHSGGGASGLGVGSGSGSGSSGKPGSSTGSGFTTSPGQAVRFTPDPTVNGPWTHTRADIPLFRSASTGGTVTTPVQPQQGTGAANLHKGGGFGPHAPQQAWGQRYQGQNWRNGKPAQQSPEWQQYQTAMNAWQQQRPTDQAAMQGWWNQRPQRPQRSRRDMLADAVAGN
jgi:hypothetical protein